MKLIIEFSAVETRRLHWLLGLKYKSKASFKKLAKQAIRDAANEKAKEIIET